MTEARWQALSVQSTAILRQVLIPINLEGFTATEVARRIGIPPGSVKLLAEYFATELRELTQPEPSGSLEELFLTAARGRLGSVELVQRKNYRRLTAGGRTLAYISGATQLRLDFPEGGRLTLRDPTEIPSAVAVLAS